MTALGLLLALFLVLLNGFFVAAEFALVKARSTRIAELAEAGSSPAKMTLQAIRHLDAYLSATQLGITLASIGLGWVGEPTVASLLHGPLTNLGLSTGAIHGVSFALAFTLISVAHIVLGELAPKSWAIQRPETVSLAVSYPLHAFYVVFRPAIWALNGLAGLLLKLVRIQPVSEQEAAHTTEEIRMLVAASGQHGVLNATEVEIAGRVLGFAEKSVSDVMVPRVDMVALDATLPLEQSIEIARTKPYSRYPVIEGDRDEVVGLVHIKDLFSLPQGTPLTAMTRDILRVPESKPLDQMLKEFQSARSHLALVVDEYGGTAGIVTLEDVMEEIVGEIVDEYDPGSPFSEVGPGMYSAPGNMRIAEANEWLGLELPEDEHETLGALVFEELGRVPRSGDRVRAAGVELRVLESDGPRVKRVLLRVGRRKGRS